jgi:hypothetical protein
MTQFNQNARSITILSQNGQLNSQLTGQSVMGVVNARAPVATSHAALVQIRIDCLSAT